MTRKRIFFLVLILLFAADITAQTDTATRKTDTSNTRIADTTNSRRDTGNSRRERIRTVFFVLKRGLSESCQALMAIMRQERMTRNKRILDMEMVCVFVLKRTR